MFDASQVYTMKLYLKKDGDRGKKSNSLAHIGKKIENICSAMNYNSQDYYIANVCQKGC